jgi:putative membrane protein
LGAAVLVAVIGSALVAIVAALHAWFLVMEMFLWQRPLGLRVFRQTPEQAAVSAVLAANQGLYNGFLAAGLGASFFLDAEFAFRVFFLACVIVALGFVLVGQ